MKLAIFLVGSSLVILFALFMAIGGLQTEGPEHSIVGEYRVVKTSKHGPDEKPYVKMTFYPNGHCAWDFYEDRLLQKGVRLQVGHWKQMGNDRLVIQLGGGTVNEYTTQWVDQNNVTLAGEETEIVLEKMGAPKPPPAYVP